MLTWDFFYTYCKEKNDKELRKAKTLKACNSFYKGLFFMFAAGWGYYVLKDEPYLPPTLLGKGSLSELYTVYPQTKWAKGF
jgi:hypothetical protein